MSIPMFYFKNNNNKSFLIFNTGMHTSDFKGLIQVSVIHFICGERMQGRAEGLLWLSH